MCLFSAQPVYSFACVYKLKNDSKMKDTKGHIVRMCDLTFDPSLFKTFRTETALDNLLSSHKGLPKGVNYMIVGEWYLTTQRYMLVRRTSQGLALA